jgi:hypothetical protein
MSEVAIRIDPMAWLGCALKDLENTFGEETIWWRGHTDAVKWELKPSALRPPLKTREGIEHELIRKFRSRAIGRLRHRPIPSSELEWLILAQHYGLPTRLLDWTENPLTALYFAVLDEPNREKSVDGCLWAISPSRLNAQFAQPGLPNSAMKRLFGAEEPTVQAMAMDAFGIDDAAIVRRFPHLKPAKQKRLGLPRVLALAAVEMDERIVAQAGRFTIHRPDRQFVGPIDRLQGHENYIREFRIPAECKNDLRKLLVRMGIRKWNLFPDLQSLAEGLKEETPFHVEQPNSPSFASF